MTETESRLLEILKTKCFTLGEFTLASGDKSRYYIDGKMGEVSSECAYLIGEVLYERTHALDIDAIGGLEVGAVPLTTAAVISYHHHGGKIEGFWVRSDAKKHGTKKKIEGNLKRGAKVVIVDDVITRGTSAAEAVDVVRERGCEIVQVLSLVDREAGARELFREDYGLDYRAIFSIRDFGVEPDVVRRKPQVVTC
jgi:orotate phosphoribosyltransferase